ncbi:hypothetical protein GCM10027419_09250 [Pandoraea terrae]
MTVFSHFEVTVTNVRIALRNAIETVYVAAHRVSAPRQRPAHEITLAAVQHLTAATQTITRSYYACH